MVEAIFLPLVFGWDPPVRQNEQHALAAADNSKQDRDRFLFPLGGAHRGSSEQKGQCAVQGQGCLPRSTCVAGACATRVSRSVLGLGSVRSVCIDRVE